MVHAPPLVRGNLVARSCSLLAGLFLFALGIVLLLETELGLSPWDVLNQGLSEHTPLSFGTANIAVALVVLVVARALGAHIGVGTAANAVLIGLLVDGLLGLDVVARLSEQPLGVRIGLMLAGIAVIGAGTGFYIGAGMGAGPRDSLMLVLTWRSGVRIGVVRGVLEASVTVVGFVLGGTVGVGTLAFVLGIGPSVEVAFWTLARSPLSHSTRDTSQIA